MPKKKGQIEMPGISRQDGELAIEFVDFLEWFQDSTISGIYKNIYIAAATHCSSKQYSNKRVDAFYNLLHMYVHKILRHKKYLLEHLDDQGGSNWEKK